MIDLEINFYIKKSSWFDTKTKVRKLIVTVNCKLAKEEMVSIAEDATGSTNKAQAAVICGLLTTAIFTPNMQEWMSGECSEQNEQNG